MIMVMMFVVVFVVVMMIMIYWLLPTLCVINQPVHPTLNRRSTKTLSNNNNQSLPNGYLSSAKCCFSRLIWQENCHNNIIGIITIIILIKFWSMMISGRLWRHPCLLTPRVGWTQVTIIIDIIIIIIITIVIVISSYHHNHYNHNHSLLTPRVGRTQVNIIISIIIILIFIIIILFSWSKSSSS